MEPRSAQHPQEGRGSMEEEEEGRFSTTTGTHDLCRDVFRKLSVFIKKSTRTGAIKTPRYPRLNYGWYNTHIPPSG